jgi:tetratricopeptide (TPR) repeat protein
VLTLRSFTCLVMAVIAAGCGAGRSKARMTPDPTAAPPTSSVSSFIEKTREVQAQASAAPVKVLGTTIETVDSRLGAALIHAKLNPSSASARGVATAYARHGIFDMAHQYLMGAVKSEPRDAANYEALARLWRDVRMSHLGLADAHRAVYYAPEWPAAHNTLGTLLQALGRRSAARAEYEIAIALDPSAAYALNNICYSDILDGRFTKAIARCNQALKVDPTLRAAQNNLGLAYAAAGRMQAALDAFNLAVDPAGALYNLGITRMARKEYRSAIDAFQAAQTRQPSFPLAAARAEQATVQLGNKANK